MSKFAEFFNLRSLVIAAITGTLSFFIGYYMQYRTVTVDGLRKNYEIFQQSQKEIDRTLSILASVASGDVKEKPDGLTDFRLQLLDAVKSARDLKIRTGANRAMLDEFEIASVELADAADHFTGPLDAKPLVEAVSEYSAARQALTDAALEEDTKFILW